MFAQQASSNKDIDRRGSSSSSGGKSTKESAQGKPGEHDVLRRLLQNNPDVNLAQLANAWNMPLDEESVKLLSSVNINSFISALNQSSSADSSATGLTAILNHLQKNVSKAVKTNAGDSSEAEPRVSVAPLPVRPGLQGPSGTQKLRLGDIEAQQVRHSIKNEPKAGQERTRIAKTKDEDYRSRASTSAQGSPSNSRPLTEAGRTMSVAASASITSRENADSDDGVRRNLAKLITQQLLSSQSSALGAELERVANVAGVRLGEPGNLLERRDTDMRHRRPDNPYVRHSNGNHGS